MALPRPTHNNVLVRPVSGPSKTEGGIHLPESAQKKSNMGEVLAVGPGKIAAPEKEAYEAWPRLPMSVKVGDIIYYSDYHTLTVRVENEDLIFLQDGDILAVK